jgi:hypothetical protein
VPIVAPYTANAAISPRPRNSELIRLCTVGSTAAADAPWSSRPAISTALLGASAQTRLVPANATTPMRSTRR